MRYASYLYLREKTCFLGNFSINNTILTGLDMLKLFALV
jgi:hypothetical protein